MQSSKVLFHRIQLVWWWPQPPWRPLSSVAVVSTAVGIDESCRPSHICYCHESRGMDVLASNRDYWHRKEARIDRVPQKHHRAWDPFARRGNGWNTGPIPRDPRSPPFATCSTPWGIYPFDLRTGESFPRWSFWGIHQPRLVPDWCLSWRNGTDRRCAFIIPLFFFFFNPNSPRSKRTF